MPNIGVMLKDEIRRLARKEVKEATAKLHKSNVLLKRAVADHKRRIADLERQNKQLLAEAESRRAKTLKASDTEVGRARITGDMIRRTRAKLRLSQSELAKLLGVSGQSVYQWERKGGRLQLRGGTKAAVVEVRTLGAREAKRRLESLAESRPRRRATKAKTKARKRGARGVSRRTARRR